MPDRELFLAALDLPSADRVRFLAEQCADDPARLARVAKLLAAHEAAGSFLEQPIDPGPTADLPPSPQTGVEADTTAAGAREVSITEDHDPEPDAGVVIAGKYKLLQQIGEGGMGTVWMADQTEPVKRRVAVKLIRADRGNSATILARFEAERQAIALMDHPHIAKLLDAGTEGGRPFFVMELVKGVPLTEYCDQHKLSVGDRLTLFMQICSAVQHAHQKAIIHRDLKPSNVLVESHDGKPVPRVIDFGLAKATSGLQLTEHTLFTGFGSVMGTPLYMAPEQANFNAIDIDTRADIYALGVILYELLTGTTPLTREEIKKVAFEEMLRLIREQEAPTPSSRLSSSEAKPTIAANRQTEPAKLGRFVKGELDWIVMKALSKDRDRRYETANGFAKDVERFLAHEPVLAGPPSVGYKLRKFVRRNRAAVLLSGGAVTVLLALVGVLVIGIVQRDNANRRYEAALQKESDSRKRTRAALDALTSDTLRGWFAQQKFMGQQQRDVLKQLVDHYEAFATEEGDDPDTHLGRINALIRIGRIQLALGDRAAAGDALRRAATLARTATTPVTDDANGWKTVSEAHTELADFYFQGKQFAEATRHYREALAADIRLRDANPGEPNSRHRVCTTRINVMASLAGLLRYKEWEAENRVAEVELEQLVSDYPNQAQFLRLLSVTLFNRTVTNRDRGWTESVDQDFRRSIELIRKYLEKQQGSVSGLEHLARSLEGRGLFLNQMSRTRDAEPLLREAIVIRSKLAYDWSSVPKYRRELATSYSYLGRTLSDEGRHPEAAEQQRRAVATARQLTAEFPDDLASGLTLVLCLRDQSRRETSHHRQREAEQAARDALTELDRLAKKHGPQDIITDELIEALAALASTLGNQARFREAETPARERVNLTEKFAEAHPGTMKYRERLCLARIYLAENLAIQGEIAEAERLLRTVHMESQSLTTGDADNVRSAVVFELTKLFAAAGRWEDSEEWANRSVDASGRQYKQNQTHPNQGFLCQSYWHRATARDHLKRYADAAADWGEAAKLADIPMDRAFYLAHRGSSLARSGDAKGAAPEFAAAIREADAALKAENLNGITYYDAAAVYALAAGGTTDQATAEKYAAEAVRLLGQAAKVGYLNDPAQRQTLRTADEYTALRPRADFQKLLADLAAKFPPPPEPAPPPRAGK